MESYGKGSVVERLSKARNAQGHAKASARAAAENIKRAHPAAASWQQHLSTSTAIKARPDQPPRERKSGTCSHWPAGKEFGFIKLDPGFNIPDVFVHQNDCPDKAALVPGDKVCSALPL